MGVMARRARLIALAFALLAAPVVGGASAPAAPGPIGGGTRASAERGGTLTVTAEGNPDYLDSGYAYTPESWQILANTGDGLMAFRRADGKAGADVVPDLAVAKPTVGAGGRTLTFVVRRGVRFSPPVNREVMPSDIKATLERLFLIDQPKGAGLYSDIVGADTLSRTRRGGLSGVTADDAAGTLTIRLVRPDPSFLKVLALPFAFVVPRETPPVDQSARPPVATGPYYVRSYEPNRQIVLERNPSFQQWSPQIPGGSVDRIVVKLGVSSSDALKQLGDGTADYTQSRIPLSRLAPLIRAKRVIVHRDIEAATYYFFMNVNVAPFNDPRVRRAVNYAIDRRHIVKLFGGEAVPTTQILPPSVPGFRRHDFYPSPDLARARRLVAQAGAVGAPVTVWGYNTAPSPAVTNYLFQVLRSLGFQVRSRFLDKSVFLDTIDNRGTGAQIGYARWQQDFPDAADYFDLLLNGRHLRDSGNLNYAYLNDAALNRMIDRARTISDPRARAAAWSDVERAAMRIAPWAPFVNTVRTDVTSRRVGSFVYSQTYGFLWMLATVR
jgi:peptide/nickel transport system substrate-binding protein